MIASQTPPAVDEERTSSSIDLSNPLVIGFGVTGRGVAAALVGRGHRPVVVDDRPADDALAHAETLGVELVVGPDADRLAALVDASSVVLPSPGIPDHHPVFELAAASHRLIASEFDLAQRWDDRPLVAITGTNGKTTVTMMVTDALERSGIRAAAVGNTETPLVVAIDDEEIETFVVEASSFRLAHSLAFRPTVAAWLNFAPDHLDAHRSIDAYRDAKAAIWRHLDSEDTIVLSSEEPVVMAAPRPAGPKVVAFGLDEGDWRVEGEWLVGPDGPFIEIDRLARRQPHDLRNAAAAAAIATAAGASAHGVQTMLAEFAGLAHRVQLVGDIDGVRWFNDSKATVPHATLAAVGGFDSVVLIAGGRNKGLSLDILAETVPPVCAVIATGDAADEVVAAFERVEIPVVRADSMAAAVAAAAEIAVAGDVVLLSPSCTSYDWYPNYGARGDDFIRLVEERMA